jgi:hypothetical protein
MAREKTARLVHLPSSESDNGVVADVNRHLMCNGGELTRTFTVPAPLQLPDMDFKNAVSSANAPPADAVAIAITAAREKHLFMIETFES